MDVQLQKRVQVWLDGPYDQKTKQEISHLLQSDPQKLIDAFYTDLSFGTAGLRGIMGIGTNRLNEYTIQMTTQGLCNQLLKKKDPKNIAVVIGFDNRKNSAYFAEKAATVFAANGITVYLFKELRPTPFISFICRQKKCAAAVMITASHNPPEYNGYKVYWSDGAQVVSPYDEEIIQEVRQIRSIDQVKTTSAKNPLIQRVADEWDEDYIQAISTLQNYPEESRLHGSELKIVYTSLHGTGITLVPKALRKWGFPCIELVTEQVIPDPNFSTVKSPNPEAKEALEKGVQVLQAVNGDILLATDPDADRIGIATLENGKVVYFTGNEIATICVSYLCETLSKHKKLSPKSAFISTIVTTELLKKIVYSFGASYFEVLTGFKYIGEMIHKWDSSSKEYDFVFGAEESYGYLLGSFVRDKDAVVTSCLLAEIALKCKREKVSFTQYLHNIYQKYGVFREKQLSIQFSPGKEGETEMSFVMQHLRKELPKTFINKTVAMIEDYQRGVRYYLQHEKQESLLLPASDVLVFVFEDQTKLVIRPSGTEPKVKLYGFGFLPSHGNVPQEIVQCDKLVDEMLSKSKEFCQNILLQAKR